LGSGDLSKPRSPGFGSRAERPNAGRRLPEHAERKAGQAGFAQLRLVTNAAFEANIRLYQFVGFQIDRTEPFRGGGAVHMSKIVATG